MPAYTRKHDTALKAAAKVLRDRRREIEWGSISIARAAFAAYDDNANTQPHPLERENAELKAILRDARAVLEGARVPSRHRTLEAIDKAL